MKRVWLVLLLVLALLLGAYPVALGEDVECIDVTCAQDTVNTDQSYIRLLCPMEGEQQVTVAIYDASGSLCYQRDYGVCSGAFQSEDIFLRLKDGDTMYQVTLCAGNDVYSLDVVRERPYLVDNEACSVGYPMEDITGQRTWKTITMLDLAALEESSETVALYASGAYEIGSVTFSVSDNQLTVSADLFDGLSGSISSGKVYVALNAATARDLGGKRFSGITGRLDRAIDVQGASCVAVYVRLVVSFDPEGAGGMPLTELSGQEALWEELLEITADEAVG